MKPVTIIVPVYNGVRFARLCLDALAGYTAAEDYRLIIMDDCSDRYTAGFLRDAARRFPDCTLIRNEENLGFLRTCNRAWARCDTPYVLLLNSDVLVTPDWLPRVLKCAEQDPKIASVNPLTNSAANIALPLPQGCNHLGLDRQLAKRPARCQDVVTGVGFCMLLRREAVGLKLFDEVYGHGYCEESDLCMRLTTSGWRTVSAEHVYVHHRGHGSFSDSNQRYLANRRIFDQRWGDVYPAQFRGFIRQDPLRNVRGEYSHPTRPWPLRHARETLRAMRRAHSRGGARSALDVLRKAIRHPGAVRYPSVSEDLVKRCSRAESISVTYVFRQLGFTGGVLSVIQLVNELVLRGIDARIAAVYTYPGYRDWTWLLSEPMVFRSPSHLIRSLPRTDIVVATEWRTAPWAARICESGRAGASAYFLQDFEPWFIPEDDQKTRQQIIADYGLIPNRIVMSDWLADKLDEYGYSTTKILLGMDLDQFYRRERENRALTVLSMARPATPWRGFSTAVEALAEVKRLRPDVRIVFFGSDELNPSDIPFEYESAGRITDQNHLARLYSDADVFLDASSFQGFGRCSLEAMACGTPVVLTDVGGVMEYARPEQNCLAVPARAPSETAAAVLRLLGDEALRQRLVEAGAATARRFCHRREAQETAEYFRGLLQQGDAANGVPHRIAVSSRSVERVPTDSA